MKLGVVTSSYPRHVGDPAGSFVAEHVRYLTGAGHRVEVVCANGSADDAIETGQNGETIVRVGAPPGLFYAGGGPEALERGGRAWLAAAPFTWSLCRQVGRRAVSWEGAIAHWLVPGALATIARAPSVPLLAIAHSGDIHTLARLRALGAFAMTAHARHRGAIRYSLVSEALADRFVQAVPSWLRQRIASAVQVCPMGIDTTRLASMSRRSTSPATVAFLGRLVAVKGPDVMLEAALRCRQPARFVIAGAGPMADRLADRIARAGASSIELVGELDAAARDQLLAQSEVVVVPSRVLTSGRTEGMPVVALEAMAAGCALVTSEAGGLSELPADTCMQAQAGDAGALAAAIDQLLAARQEREQQVARARAWVASRDWSVLGPRLLPPVNGTPPVRKAVRTTA